jgi:hypothetical protein
MTTIQSTTSQTKSVNIYQNHNSNFRAMYVQTYKGEQQVLQVKEFVTMSNAKKWATKILN